MGSPETIPSALADDHDLLREYVERGSESSFRILVERHGGMVYGVARRLVGREHAAAEITQSVFLALAQKSSSLSRSVPLAGWLHTAARYAASHWLRGEARRRERESAAWAEQVHAVNDEAERTWEQITPWLDAALASLNGRDREAVLLRFFEQRSFSDVAAGLGTTEDAAKMRVSRAVRKLRAFLQRRGTVVNAVVLTACLTGHAASTAPVHVVQAASHVAGSAAVHGTTIAALAAAVRDAIRSAHLRRMLLITTVAVGIVAGGGLGMRSLLTKRHEVVTWDLASQGRTETLLRDSTAILGGWRASPGGLAIDEMAWAHLAVPGPFAADYRLQIAFTQQNPAGVVELLLPVGQEILLVPLRPAAAAGTEVLATAREQPPSRPIEHRADVEVRSRDNKISLLVQLDGVAIAETKDVSAALRRATMVPQQPRGVLGLGAMRTGAVFTRLEVQTLPSEPRH